MHEIALRRRCLAEVCSAIASRIAAALPVGGERLLALPFECQRHADAGSSEGDVRLPLEIGRIALRQRLGDRKALAIVRQRLGASAEHRQRVGDFVEAGREITLKVCVVRIGRRDLADERQCRLE